MSASEHNIGEDVLKSGENIKSEPANETIDQHDSVQKINNGVSVAPDGGPFYGVAGIDVVAGQELNMVMDGCEANVIVSEAVSDGDALTPDGGGGFRQAVEADDDDIAAVADEDGGVDDIIKVYVAGPTGVTA